MSLSRASTRVSNQQQLIQQAMYSPYRNSSQRSQRFIPQQEGLTNLISAGNRLAHSALKAKMHLNVQATLQKSFQRKTKELDKVKKENLKITKFWLAEVNQALKQIKPALVNDGEYIRRNKNTLVKKNRFGRKPRGQSQAKFIEEKRISNIQTKIQRIQRNQETYQEDQRHLWREFDFLKLQTQAERVRAEVRLVDSENRSRQSEESQ